MTRETETREASLPVLLVGRFVSMLLRKSSLESSASFLLSSALSLVPLGRGSNRTFENSRDDLTTCFTMCCNTFS